MKQRFWFVALLLCLCLTVPALAAPAVPREPPIEIRKASRVFLGDPANLLLQYLPSGYAIEALDTVSLPDDMVLHSYSIQGEREYTLYFLRIDSVYTDFMTADEVNDAVHVLARHALNLTEDDELDLYLQPDTQRPGYRWTYPLDAEDRYALRQTSYGFFTMVIEGLEEGETPYLGEDSEYYLIFDAMRQQGNG